MYNRLGRDIRTETVSAVACEAGLFRTDTIRTRTQVRVSAQGPELVNEPRCPCVLTQNTVY